MSAWIVLAIMMFAAAPSAPSPAPSMQQANLPCDPPRTVLAWHTDYRTAFRIAQRSRRNLFIYFQGDERDLACRSFESTTLANPDVQRLVARCVPLRLRLRASTGTTTLPNTVLEHASLAEMQGMPGVAIIDFTDPESPFHGYVVSQIPFQPQKYFQREPFHGAKSIRTLLTLPAASLTQRTLIYAVRMQHEAPRSTHGSLNHDLCEEARKHSEHQASIHLQGHHDWESRFAAINEQLEDHLVPVEVCAESWPGENLVEAAVECVYSWRRSAGHWRAVAAEHPQYGYDMRRGSNGIWYATGIFGKRRTP